MRAWVLVLVACDPPPNAPPGLDHIEEIAVEAHIAGTDVALDELGDAVPAIGFGFAQRWVSGYGSYDDGGGALVALDQLVRYSAAHPATALIVTVHPQEEAYLLHGGVFDHDELVLAPLIANARATAHVPVVPERSHVRGRLPALVPALAGDTLVWSDGALAPDGTLRATEPTIGVPGALPVALPAPANHRRQLVARLGDTTIALDESHGSSRRSVYSIVAIAADGVEHASERIHGISEVAISRAHAYLAVAARRDGVPVLLRVALPSLAVTELARMPRDGAVEKVSVDDDGAVIAFGDRGLCLYDGHGDPRPITGYDQVVGFDTRSIALAGWAEPWTSRARRYRLVEIDRTTNTERVVIAPHATRDWFAPRVLRAGATWYVLAGRQLDAIDPTGMSQVELLRAQHVDGIAIAPDGRVAIHSDGVLHIFKDGQLLAEAPLDGATSNLAFAR